MVETASTSMNNSEWQDQIRQKLIDVFSIQNVESLTRVLFYLDEEEKTYRTAESPVWRTLKSTLYSENVFKAYAERLADDTKRAEKDEGFRTTMSKIYSEMMECSDQPLPEDHDQSFDLVRLGELNVSERAGFAGLARAWCRIPPESQLEILKMCTKSAANTQVVDYVMKGTVGAFKKVSGTVVMVALSAVFLGLEAIKNIRRWWKGEITGKRCAKNIVDASFAFVAGAGGGIAGGAIGSIAGPIGALAGGFIGGTLGSSLANFLIDRLTQYLFGLPKEEALENAYNYLGVKQTSSNQEVNAAYRELCLKHHPDKGGSDEEFHFLQNNMSVIKASRNQL